MIKRRRRSAKERGQIFAHEDGTCHICGGKVQVGEAWEISHEIPLELGGADEGPNLRVAHAKCHKRRTAERDVPDIAKAKRRESRHTGAVRPKQTIRSAGFPAREPKAPKIPIPARTRDIFGRPI